MKIETKAYRIEGMSCASCVKRVETALSEQPGVESCSINLASETALVKFNSNQVSSLQLEAAVNRVGYRMTRKDRQLRKVNSIWIQHHDRFILILSILFTLPLVIPMMGSALNLTWELSKEYQLLLATPVQFLFGFRFYRNAWRALKNRSPNMDVLVALGTSSAFGLSVYLGFWHDHSSPQHLYFESSAVIITLVLLGKGLERWAKQETTKSLRALEALRPETAQVFRDQKWTTIPIYKVALNDRLLIRPGDRIPLDCIIATGYSSTDESLITGESLPVPKRPGDRLISGSLNIDGAIEAIVEHSESESVLAQIIRLLEDASSKKAPIQKLVDQVSEFFVPAVLIISILTVGYWLWNGSGLEAALINGISVLVIACPCALGLATPTALMVGRGLAAKRGILIKDIEALEKAQHLKAIVFDKTGTLTEGRPKLMGTYLNPSYSGTMDEFLQVVYSVQINNSHPLAQSVVKAANIKGLNPLPITDARTIPGKGSEARINGMALIQIGSQNWMIELGYVDQVQDLLNKADLNRGFSVTWVADSNSKKVIGVQWFADPIKAEAPEAIALLHQRGLETALLTGDLKSTAESANQKLGLKYLFYEVSPSDKLQKIRDLRTQFGVVAMVGDGINDAPAIAAADIGMAMAHGTDAALGASSLTLMNDSPLQVVYAIDISKATYRKIKHNLFWAFIYNTIGIPLAAAGVLNPMMAASAMAFSSVSVVVNSLLLSQLQIRGPFRLLRRKD